MGFVESFYELIDSGEPVVRSWPMVRSLWTPVTWAAIYLLFVKRLGPYLMRDRKPFDLRALMVVYNFSVVAVYVYGLGTNVFYLLTTRDGYEKICTPHRVVKNHYLYTCAVACWYLYIIKYVELADTVFFVLRKKFHLITNLHVIHHAVLPAIGFFFMRVETTALQLIPGGINAFVHILMYSYYGLAAMGPEVQKKLWWKEYLTLLQMGQFVVILLFMLVVVPLVGCHTSKHGIYIDLFFASFFLILFCNFYVKTYRKKPTRNEDHVRSDSLYSLKSK